MTLARTLHRSERASRFLTF